MFQHSAQSATDNSHQPSIVLTKGQYTRIEAFFAGVLTQLPIYCSTSHQKERCPESPKVVDLDENTFELQASKHASVNVNSFKDKVKQGSIPEEWQQVLATCPLKPVDQKTLIASLSDFSKFKLANYLCHFIDQFEKDMQKFINENDAHLTELKLKDDPEFILNIAMLLSHAISPFEDMIQADDETTCVFTFYGVAANNFCDIKLLSPTTVASCCEAMRRVVSATLTQAIGAEKLYAGMLGSPPRVLKAGQKPRLYTPSQKMRDIIEAYELTSDVIHAAAASVAILDEPYIIPDKCFEILDPINHEDLLWDFFFANIDFISQVDLTQCPKSLYQATLLRLWDAFVANERCPQWIKDQNANILINIRAEQVPFFSHNAVINMVKDILRLYETVSRKSSNSILNKIMHKYEQDISDKLKKVVNKPEELEAFMASLLPDEKSLGMPESQKTFERLHEVDNADLEKFFSLVLANIISKSDGLRNQKYFLKLVKSNLPFYSKLHFIAVIATEMPKTFRSRRLYSKLAALININHENVKKYLKKFLVLNYPDTVNFKNLHHALEYYAIRADLNNVGFETSFKRLVDFLVETGVPCNLKNFFVDLLPDNIVVLRNCYDYLEIKKDLTPKQKENFNYLLNEISIKFQQSSFRERVDAADGKRIYSAFFGRKETSSPLTVVRSPSL